MNDIYIKLKDIINPKIKEEDIHKIKSYSTFINPLLNIDDIININIIADDVLNKYTINNINDTINDIIKNLINNISINQNVNYDEIIIYLFKNIKKYIISNNFINDEQSKEINKYLYNYIELQAYINSFYLNVYSYIFNNKLINDIIKIEKFNYNNNYKSSF